MSLKLKGRILEINKRWVSAMENLRKAFFLTEKVIARRGEEREGERDGTYRKKETEREATLKESMDIVSDLVI